MRQDYPESTPEAIDKIAYGENRLLGYFEKPGSIAAMNHFWRNICDIRRFGLAYARYFAMSDREGLPDALQPP